jgi:hypothetical protein
MIFRSLYAWLPTFTKPSLTFTLTNLAKTFSDLAAWKFLEESGNPEMAFDNYRITIQITKPHITQNYFV